MVRHHLPLNVSKKTAWAGALVFLFVGLLLRSINLVHGELSFFDEGSYILEAARMFGREPSNAYFYARPGFIFFLGLARTWVQDPVLSGRLLNLLGFIFLMSTMFLYLSKHFSRSLAVLSLLFLACSSLHVAYSFLILPDALTSCLLFGAIVCYLEGEERKQLQWSALSGGLLAFAVLCGSYRLAPTLLGLGVVFLWFGRRRQSWLQRLAMLFFVALLILGYFEREYNFSGQISGVLKNTSEGWGKNFSKFDPDFLFFPFVLFVFSPLIIVLFGVTIDRVSHAKHRESPLFTAIEQRYFGALMGALILSPIVFNTFYFLRAPRVFSSALPAYAIFLAWLSLRIKSKRILAVTIVFAAVLGFGQSLLMSRHMGLKGSAALAAKAASLKGVVAYQKGVMIRATTILSPETKVVVGWDCPYRPSSCNPHYYFHQLEDWNAFSPIERDKWEKIEEVELIYEFPESLLRRLEAFDSGPSKISALSWLELKGPVVENFVLARNKNRHYETEKKSE